LKKNSKEEDDLSSYENLTDRLKTKNDDRKIFKLDSDKKAYIAKQIIDKIKFDKNSIDNYVSCSNTNRTNRSNKPLSQSVVKDLVKNNFDPNYAKGIINSVRSNLRDGILDKIKSQSARNERKNLSEDKIKSIMSQFKEDQSNTFLSRKPSIPNSENNAFTLSKPSIANSESYTFL